MDIDGNAGDFCFDIHGRFIISLGDRLGTHVLDNSGIGTHKTLCRGRQLVAC
ncbi:hypothetical protein BLSMQ_0516 [Brevibacterium aurantiacum]|uniref:Uncharacterized protein n=1 Tax=Brevibacterium aurantiacum TaxID=273384 RepID=A0A1D7VZS8_BREAU|nr:hypothetical protein BLSMQ_0516 [Brevibacterium aurantiacum]